MNGRGERGNGSPLGLANTRAGNKVGVGLIALLSLVGSGDLGNRRDTPKTSPRPESKGGTVPPVPPFPRSSPTPRCPDCGAVAWKGWRIHHRHRQTCTYEETDPSTWSTT